ncbi:NitT/TauT family transport system permease protein [Maridesulfovibrio ferrireducens]|uniref:NitT/TauT family transport system permease protein n=1 Tax=Maridesulfovibrio ferrireducens TaxID=246191 RepID=A0A1G9JJR1_9BACT|nr:ABC transporter permease [Maridesulfovibrio ferrireducens]SDL37807.1 NitT/TauT family transport system permease protein [Maridesulfovibrio ferrireducens]
MKDRALSLTLPIIAPALLAVTWMILARQISNQVILPGIEQVAELLGNPTEDLISMGSLFSNVLVSLVRVIMGYAIAAFVAIPLGIVMGYYGFVFKFFNGFLNLFRPIPPLAWVPLVLAWFGVSSLATISGVETGQMYIYLNNIKFSMLFIIFIGAFYPILTSTIHGVRNVNKTLIDSARVLGASEYQVFMKVLIPASMPSIITGMRIGLGIAWMCLVSAEMLPGSLSGIGYMITHAFTLASTDIVIAGMISIGIVGTLMDMVFRRIEHKKFSWRRQAG